MPPDEEGTTILHNVEIIQNNNNKNYKKNRAYLNVNSGNMKLSQYNGDDDDKMRHFEEDKK